MAEVKKSGEKNTATPILIILGIFVLLIVGIYWVSQSSGDTDPQANSNVSNSGVDDSAELYSKAPAGATPAHTLGNPSAAIVLEEFADFQCGSCAVAHPKLKEVVNQYGSKIRFVFRNFPLVQAHPNAYDAAVAAESAGMQGKFWQMQEMIFQNQGNWSNLPNARNNFKDYAQKIGLDVTKFENDSLGLAAKSRVDQDMQRGNALRIQSTPTVLMNGKPIPYQQIETDALKTLIDAELARLQGGKTEKSQ